uniref:hypothetical protein n=1 Tax=Epibacterium ulvae TaxID=1156985 RepID=UPI002493AF89
MIILLQADIHADAAKVNFVRTADPGPGCSECPVSADFVEELSFARAEVSVLNSAQAPFLSGFSCLLRCRKDLGQFAEVLGGGSEEEFVICAAR